MVATLKDIADRVGVSPTAVSFAIRGKNPGKRRLSEDTVRRIREAATEMGYRPNGFARRLVNGNTLNIGLVVWSADRVEEPLFPKFLKGIGAVCDNLGYGLELSMVYAEKNERVEQLLTQVLKEKTVDGYIMIFVDEIDEDDISRIKEANVPLVWITRHMLDGGISNVRIETGQAYYISTCHLIEQGCKRVAFLAGDLSYQADREALAGYRRATNEFGLPDDQCLIAEGNYRRNPSRRAARQLLELNPRPDGIVAANDISGIQVINICNEKGLSVPGDVAVIGYNDTSLAEMIDPQLSSMRVPAEKMGRDAAAFLVDICEKKRDAVECVEPFVPELVVRYSSEKIKS